ncbi:RNA dependent RNA polymerase-domain-containing protein [Tirmania nivea]|nr:RNA dependent RNA polymerase-domain-containing protein [Tirmania nivea]
MKTTQWPVDSLPFAAPQVQAQRVFSHDTPTFVATPSNRLEGARQKVPFNPDQLTIRVRGIPNYWSLLNMYDIFEEYGTIIFMEFFEDLAGNRDGGGRINPSPAQRFWEKMSFEVLDVRGHSIKLNLHVEENRSPRTVASPVDVNRIYPESFTYEADMLEFGIMYSENQMLSMYRTQKGAKVRFTVNLFRRHIDVTFKHDFKAPPPENTAYRNLFAKWKRMIREQKAEEQKDTQQTDQGSEDEGSEPSQLEADDTFEGWERDETYRFQLQFEHLGPILEQPTEDENSRAFVFSLPDGFPPEFFRKLHAVAKSFSDDPKERIWNEWDAWFRQTSVTYHPQCTQILPTTLRQPYATIDIGRWTTYRVSFNQGNQRYPLDNMLNALKDWNIETHLVEELTVIEDAPSPVWEIIDAPDAAKTLIEELDHKQYLSFPLRYQLEAVISYGYLSEYNLDMEFIRRLRSQPESRALALLERVFDRKERIYQPLQIFDWTGIKTNVAEQKIENYCVLLRRVIITPTTVRFATPSVEYSNRVLRSWREHADKFLRVQFADEITGHKLRYHKGASKDDTFTRVHNTLTNGINIGDRHYEFLAFGSSQFREHGAYMFASDKYINASDIRSWMGNFTEIKTIGKYCARLGQCFSATRAITGVKVNITYAKDIKRNGKNFTDGVGKMSQFVAQMIAHDLKLPGRDPPSAFQFRLGGCKGVLAVSPHVQNSDVVIRPSQEKFTAEHKGLEVIRPATFASACLNRQLILVLTALEVPDSVFEQMLHKQLDDMKAAMIDPQKALERLTKNIDENHMSLAIASMINDGFMQVQEPFLMTILQLWRAYQHKGLKEKTKITVEKGAFLLGVVDETGILKGHFNTNEEQTDDNRKKQTDDVKEEQADDNLPQIFCQVSVCGIPGKYEVIEGTCIIARNPSLHPGDVRVVKAVDIPELHHLRDVLVLPQTGDRDLAGMCSGGDLDGDDYFISWDENLKPPIKNYEPMDYSPPPEALLDRPVETKDMISFFVTYMKNDRLGHIANTHVAWADKLELGVLDNRCIELAQLHSFAVDYPKTGYPAIMPRRLKPREYPHFMGKEREKTYKSKKILGRLYDQVERVDFQPIYSTKFDQRILGYTISERLLRSAKAVKAEYDIAIKRIMGQYDIKTEFEIFTTFVLKYKGCNNEYNFHEELGRLQKSLCERFQKIVYERVGGRNKPALASYVVAMYKVTHQEMVIALRHPNAHKHQKDPSKMPIMSFPWIFREILGVLAKGGAPYNGKVDYDPPTYGPGGKEKERIEELPQLDYDELPGLTTGVIDETSSGHDTSQSESEL